MMDQCCVYSLSFPNGKQYIGIAKNFDKRWAVHKHKALTNKGWLVHSAMRKYGLETVVKKILLIGTLDFAREMERRLIAGWNTISPHGYNLTEGGELAPSLMPEVREKIRAAAIRRYADPKVRKAQSTRTKGQHVTQEQIDANRDSRIAAWKDPEYRNKTVASHSGKKWANNGTDCRLLKQNEPLPEGWAHGRLLRRFS